MKILYTTHQFLPDFFSGTEILTRDTATEMVKRGHEAHVFTGHLTRQRAKTDAVTDEYEYDGLPVHRYFYSPESPDIAKNPIRSEYDNPIALDFFYKKIKEIRPDIVHFYHLQRLSASIIDVCASLKVPTIYSATDFWAICPKQQLFLPDYTFCKGPDDWCLNCIRHFLDDSRFASVNRLVQRVPDRILGFVVRYLASHKRPRYNKVEQVRALVNRVDFIKKKFKKVDKILVATPFMQDMFAKWGIDASKLGLLAFGIDDRPIRHISVKGNQAGLRIGFIGSLFDHKGAHVLVEAMSYVPKDLPVDVLIYGDLKQFPQYSGRLVQSAHHDSRIRFKGTFDPETMCDVLYNMDILVVPSLWHENTPLVIHAAQHAGVPVIGSNVSGISAVVSHGKNGLLFDRGDVAGLASIIGDLCRNRLKVKKLSENAWVANSLTTYADCLEEVYMQVKA